MNKTLENKGYHIRKLIVSFFNLLFLSRNKVSPPHQKWMSVFLANSLDSPVLPP